VISSRPSNLYPGLWLRSVRVVQIRFEKCLGSATPLYEPLPKGEVVAKERVVTKRQDCIEEAVTEAGSVRGKENCRSLGFARDDK
jgi:hypothetical protein